ncbi:MAG: lactate racemase domain-containing protein [Deltaproteobacteria bacterium]|nr:lactate racemase domain-containing protein [Deltaproteobacteria bacterium]
MTFTEEKVREIIEAGTPAGLYENKRVLVLTPDGTRTCPLPMMVRLLGEVIGARAAKLDFMVALGTHPVMTEQQILDLYRISPGDRREKFSRSSFLCHRWDLPETFRRIGEFTEEEVAVISGGLLKERVPIDINGSIFDYDQIVILGPVFPHEVVGFSGGAKYLFPGISGGEFLHFFHWLSALITCRKIIGRKENPVRQVIHRALEKIDLPIHLLAMVVGPEANLSGLFTGDVLEAWSAAADLSATIHIVEKKRPFRIVLGRAPVMYDEIWVAGKVVYKLEQVVAPGGELIVYAPHVREISSTWGDQLEQVGYHVRDYFLAHPEILCTVPRGVLAHSTQVCGTGCYENGVETPDVKVVLATAIPEETCRKIGLGYLDPAKVRIDDYRNREAEGVLFVDHAGETLYRLAGNA